MPWDEEAVDRLSDEELDEASKGCSCATTGTSFFSCDLLDDLDLLEEDETEDTAETDLLLLEELSDDEDESDEDELIAGVVIQ